jgi:hypothetical protein
MHTVVCAACSEASAGTATCCALTPRLSLLQMLFSVPTAQVAPRVEALPAALGISKEEALLLLQDDPKFLLQPSSTLAASWKALQGAARARPEWQEQIGGWTAGTLYRCDSCSPHNHPSCLHGGT